jgi:hypothetical protein
MEKNRKPRATRRRYVKVKTLEEALTPEMSGWVEQAKRGAPGWT